MKDKEKKKKRKQRLTRSSSRLGGGMASRGAETTGSSLTTHESDSSS